jgi:hypothetical protein
VLVMEARVVGFVDVGEVMSIEGRALIDQDWSSLSRSWVIRLVLDFWMLACGIIGVMSY